MIDNHELQPQDTDAERSALGAMLVNANAVPVVGGMLVTEDFYSDTHRRVFDAILKVHASGVDPDMVSVASLIPNDTNLIYSLAEFVPSASNAASYASIVREKSVLRSIIKTGNDIVEIGYAGGDRSQDVIDKCEDKMLDVLKRKRESETSHVQSTEESFHVFAKDLDRRRKGEIVGLPWPPEWSALGKRIGPLEPGSLTVVAARPSVGKTMLGLQLQRYLCGQGNKVLFVSRELTITRLIRRHISSYGADLRNLQTGKLNDRDNKAMDIYLKESSGWPVLYDHSSRTIEDIKREVELNKPDLVIVDYLQRLAYDTEKEYAAITRIVNELQDLTLETDTPVVCLSQLSRPMKGMENKSPSMSDVRGSGAVEERAANMILLHRKYETSEEEQYGKKVEVCKAPSNNGYFIVSKAADGETGHPIPITFSGSGMRITETL